MHPKQTSAPLNPAAEDDTVNRLSSPRVRRTRPGPTNRVRRAGAMAFALLATAIAVFAAAGVAQASANKCSSGLNIGCVDVKGKHRDVDRIRSQIIPAGRSCIQGHSQVMIGGRHYADSNGGRDDIYCGTGYPGKKLPTGTWYVNRAYAKGTKICAKFWQRINGRYREGGNACATVG